MLDDKLGNISWDRLQSKVMVFGDKLVDKSDEKESEFREEKTGKSSAIVFNVRFRGNCYNCDKPGHSAKYCHSKKRNDKLYKSYGKNSTRENSNNERYRYKCGKKGHKAKFCRSNNSANIGSNSFTNIAGAKNEGTNQGSDTTKEEDKSTQFSFVANCNTDSMDSERPRENEENVLSWWLDSEVTHHLINSDKYFSNSVNLRNPIKINIGENGCSVLGIKVGNIRYKTNLGREVTIRNVIYAGELPHNLLSCSAMDRSGLTLRIANDLATTSDCEGKNVFSVRLKERDLYYEVNFSCAINEYVSANQTMEEEKKEERNLWHRGLAHLNGEYVDRLRKDERVPDMDQKQIPTCCCEACLHGKSCRLPFTGTRSGQRNCWNSFIRMFMDPLYLPQAMV